MIHKEQTPPLANKFRKIGREFIPSVQKTTIATKLTKAHMQTKMVLPERYREHALVFSEEEAH